MKKLTYDLPRILPGRKVRYGKKHKSLYVLLSVLLVLSILIGSGAYFVNSFLDYDYNEIEKSPEILGFEEVKDKRIINIALFGVDTRNAESFSGRSDSTMILSVNTGTNKIKLISVMRDSLVPIEKDGKKWFSKFNSAYASGGPALAMKTLNTIFDLDISEYVAVNFFKLADIIDLVGGIEVEITQSEIKLLNNGVAEICNASGVENNITPITKAGVQHLCGKQAVSYARIRYAANALGTNNDYGRTDRQRLVMEKLFKKALSMKKSEYAKLVKPVLGCCQTSLTYGEIIDVVLGVLSKNPEFSETRIPQTSYLMASPKTNAGSVVYYDLNFAAKVIHNFIYKDISPETYVEVYGIEKNDWYKKGFEPPKIDIEVDES